MNRTLRDLLTHQSDRNPDKIALVDGDRRLTYAQLVPLVDGIAGALQQLGIRKGDRVAIYLPKSIDDAIAQFAVWSIGAVAIDVNDLLRAKQVAYIVGHADASLIISNQLVRSRLHHIPLADDRIVAIEEMLLQGAEYVTPSIIAADLSTIIYTSGSTGFPKGIMLSHENLLAGACIVSEYLHLDEDDVIISLLPYSFDYGLNQLLTSVLVGAKLVIQRSLFPADICATLLQERVTGIAGVPMLWHQLADERSCFLRRRFPRLRYITNSGGPMPESLTRQIRQAHPHVAIYLMYGLTEAFRSTYLPPEQVDIRPTSIGRAIPNVEILLLNDRGERCVPGEVGELVHRGGTVSMGYWNDPEATSRVFRPHPFPQYPGGVDEMVVYSGDYARMDEEGYLYFVGRRDAMIKSHGMRVSPDEIEEYLFASGMVSHAVIFAVASGKVEPHIVAAVVPGNPAAFSEERLQRYCKLEIPEYMRPAMIWQCDRLPQTSSGKPDRVRIREMYLEVSGMSKEDGPTRTARQDSLAVHGK